VKGTLIGLVFAANAAVGQNSDLGLLLSGTVNRFNFGSRTETQYRFGLQVNYAWQAWEGARGRLYAELAVSPQSAPVGQGTVTVVEGNRIASQPEGIVFLTPGLRYHLNFTPRFAVYAAAGLGAAFRRQSVWTSPVNPPGPRIEVLSRWQADPAYNVGAGADFRLTRLVSVRGELRRFRTTAQPGFGDGRTFPAAQAGLALHF
jgi:opacity protein-like surface antigen